MKLEVFKPQIFGKPHQIPKCLLYILLLTVTGGGVQLLNISSMRCRNVLLSSAILTSSVYVIPMLCLMLCIHVCRGLHLPLLPTTHASINCLCIPFFLKIWPRYLAFLLMMSAFRLLLWFAAFSTSSLVLCSLYETRNIFRRHHISNASSFFISATFIIQVSDAYIRVEMT